jgi:hypothetical protein
MAEIGEPEELQQWLRRLTLWAYSEGTDAGSGSHAAHDIDGASMREHSARFDANVVNARLLEALHLQRSLQDSLLDLSASAAKGAIAASVMYHRGIQIAALTHHQSHSCGQSKAARRSPALDAVLSSSTPPTPTSSPPCSGRQRCLAARISFSYPRTHHLQRQSVRPFARFHPFEKSCLASSRLRTLSPPSRARANVSVIF